MDDIAVAVLLETTKSCWFGFVLMTAGFRLGRGHEMRPDSDYHCFSPFGLKLGAILPNDLLQN